MEKGIRVKDIQAGSHVSGVFAVRAAALAQARNGAPYWKLTLTDASGNIEARIWHPLSAGFADIPAGSLVLAAGGASMFRDQCQLSIDRLSILEDEEKAALCLADFMPASPYGIEAMSRQLRELMDEEFRHRPWRALMDGIFTDQTWRTFREAPAAKSVHHAYAGGLLEHSLSVAGLCRLLADKYPELDRQTLIAGAILHDIGKIRELSGGLAPDYTTSGNLMGHIVLGLELIAPALAASGLEPWLAEHLRHLIASHHGKLEYGAPRQPQTAEAITLHYADNLDAKMAQCRALFADAPGRPAWSARVPSLDGPIFWPLPTPAPENPAAGEESGDNYRQPCFMEEDAAEPPPEELAELYADPAFNRAAAPDGVSPSPTAGHGGRPNRRNNQCSLL